MPELAPIFKKAYWSLVVLGSIYAIIVYALTYPSVQRHALYAHKLNPAIFQNVTNFEQFGFLQNQIQALTIETPDQCTLHAYHLLPSHVYNLHEGNLKVPMQSQPHFKSDAAKSNTDAKLAAVNAPSLNILASDPSAVVIVNLHGNAAHAFSDQRPNVYNAHLSLSSPTRPVHVLAFDYRGFGHSECSPTENGLITDTRSIVSFLTDTLSIPPSRIILVGQSLGTAVAIGTISSFSSTRVNEPFPHFRGIILESPFTHLPKLLETYSIKGIIPPILSPLMPYPRIQKWVLSHIADHWDTAARVQQLVADPAVPLDLTILHARDDWEIPWREGRGVWDAAILGSGGTGDLTVMEGRAEQGEEEIRVWEGGSEKVEKRVRWERVKYGGHNKLGTWEHGKRAVLMVVEKDVV